MSDEDYAFLLWFEGWLEKDNPEKTLIKQVVNIIQAQA